MAAITATNLSKRYGRISAVDGVSFAIEPGEIVGFLGPNGAGKTTTLRMLAGLIRPSSGSSTILGERVPGRTLLRVGTMIEEPSFYGYLSGRDNLRHAAKLHGGVSEARVDEVLSFVGLAQAAHKKVKAYSQGMRQRLGLARALLWQPEVLLLDEPTNGLDPVGIAEVRESLRRVAQQGVTILISSHILAEIEKLVERILAIDKGRLRYDGSLQQLLAQLDAQALRYRLQATDVALLEASLVAMGYAPERLGEQTVRVAIPQADADRLITELVYRGVTVIEAQRERDSLEGAYLRLLKGDGGAA